MDALFQMSDITATSCVGEVGEFGGRDNSIIIGLLHTNQWGNLASTHN